MRVGLYFGTFNPIHVGHLVIANYMAEYTDLDQVWMVVTPQNPLKKKSSLLADYHRLALVRVAIHDNYKLRASDVEFGLPQPNYTSTTLAHLKEKYPEYEFCMIMGEDNLRTLHRWYNYEHLMKNYRFYVYPRVLTRQEEEEVVEIGVRPENGFSGHPSIIMCEEAPVMKVSSSFVRQSIKDGKDVRYLLTEPVHRYIDEMNFYK
jgi:nicotinate-nucleotide adenylyltransferase